MLGAEDLLAPYQVIMRPLVPNYNDKKINILWSVFDNLMTYTAVKPRHTKRALLIM